MQCMLMPMPAAAQQTQANENSAYRDTSLLVSAVTWVPLRDTSQSHNQAKHSCLHTGPQCCPRHALLQRLPSCKPCCTAMLAHRCCNVTHATYTLSKAAGGPTPCRGSCAGKASTTRAIRLQCDMFQLKPASMPTLRCDHGAQELRSTQPERPLHTAACPPKQVPNDSYVLQQLRNAKPRKTCRHHGLPVSSACPTFDLA